MIYFLVFTFFLRPDIIITLKYILWETFVLVLNESNYLFFSVDGNPVEGFKFHWSFNNTSESADIQVSSKLLHILYISLIWGFTENSLARICLRNLA